MRKLRFSTLLLLAGIVLAGAGCSSAPTSADPPTKRVTTAIPQTGSNVGRRVAVADSADAPDDNQPTQEKPAKAKPKSAQVSEEVVTRGGFR